MDSTQKRVLAEKLTAYRLKLDKDLTLSIGNSHYHKNKKSLSRVIGRHRKLQKAIAVLYEDVIGFDARLDSQIKSKFKIK